MKQYEILGELKLTVEKRKRLILQDMRESVEYLGQLLKHVQKLVAKVENGACRVDQGARDFHEMCRSPYVSPAYRNYLAKMGEITGAEKEIAEIVGGQQSRSRNRIGTQGG